MRHAAAALALSVLVAACGRGSAPPASVTAPAQAPAPAAALACSPADQAKAVTAFDASYGELVVTANQANIARSGAIADAVKLRARLREAQSRVNDALAATDEAKAATTDSKREALYAFARDAVARASLDLVRAHELASAYADDFATARSRGKSLQATQARPPACDGPGGAKERLQVIGRLAAVIEDIPEPGAINVDLANAEDNIRVGQAIVLDRLVKVGVASE
jgi:hypothetical protein